MRETSKAVLFAVLSLVLSAAGGCQKKEGPTNSGGGNSSQSVLTLKGAGQ